MCVATAVCSKKERNQRNTDDADVANTPARTHTHINFHLLFPSPQCPIYFSLSLSLFLSHPLLPEQSVFLFCFFVCSSLLSSNEKWRLILCFMTQPHWTVKRNTRHSKTEDTVKRCQHLTPKIKLTLAGDINTTFINLFYFFSDVLRFTSSPAQS